MKKPPVRVYVKSVGFGVMIAELTPSPERSETTNGSSKSHAEKLDRMVKDAGWSVQEVLPDPGDPAVAVLILPEGLPPSVCEYNQTGAVEWEILERVVSTSGSQRLAERISMLKNVRAGA